MTSTDRTTPAIPAARLDTAALGLLGAFVLLMPAAASFVSLRAWAADNLGLTGWSTALAPLSLDLVMALFIVSSVHATRRGQSAGGSRFLVLLTMAGSALANYHHGLTISTAAAFYYGAMPVVGALGLETMIRRVRHAALEQLGVVEGPLPRFRPMRWAVDLRGTWRAWTYGVREGVTNPRQAIVLSRRPSELAAAGVPDPTELAATAATLQTMSKTSAMRHALTETGGDVPEAVNYLARHGVAISATHAHQIARKARSERPQLAAVPASSNGEAG